MPFVPLHVHSQFSILDALASVNKIAKKAAEFKMPAVALTDHGNLFGAVDFYKACKQEGVKPIIGCELYVATGSRKDKSRGPNGKVAYHLTLLAKDIEGYKNLCKLSSLGFLEGFYYHPRIDKELLAQHSQGLVCLSGCMSSSISTIALNGSYEELLQEIRWFKDLFKDDFYLEIQRHPMHEEDIQNDGIDQEAWLYQNYKDVLEKQNKLNNLLIKAGKELGIKVVATNDSHYIERDEWKAHEILLNVQSGEPCEIWERDSLGNPKVCVPNPKRRVYPSHEYHFKSPERMMEIFSDIPETIQNTIEIADKCNLEIDFKTKHYPIFIPPSLQNKEFTKEEQIKAAEDFLWQLCKEGIEKRYTAERLKKVAASCPGKDPMDVVKDRLNWEMDIITSKGMCDYLLIVYDFIHWAKQSGIPMGPGRGSGAGSIILYLVGITDIEPLRFSLFFERFINPERLSYPDIDVDICMDRRSEVIEYTLQKYGKDNVAQIITFGTMKAKMAIKDVGRVLSVPLSKVNLIAKLVPEDPKMTLDKALDTDPELFTLYQNDQEARRIIDIAKQVEGCIRNTGIHAAGIIVSGEPLTKHIPICNAKDSHIAATQYSMKPVELVGMLKIDFLGLKTLTCIQKAVESVKINTGLNIDWTNLDLEDSNVFALLNQGKTLGVFQLESGGMRELCRHLHLDKFEEIIAVCSLYRPGPMEMIPSYINRKLGKETIEYDHPWMAEILSETYGIMVYQEQVMQIAQKLANYTLGEGDVLRRAMGKKDMAEMATQREKFSNGALENGIDKELSTRIFDKVEKFASYGFNKSHSAAYAYLSYVTAFLKANYPNEWMAALMTCDRDDLSKVAKFIRECQNMSIPILPPDVNEAGPEFAPTTQGIRFAMTGIKGIGQGVVDAIVQERTSNGPFASLYEFLTRVDTKRIGKKNVEHLIDAGCFDFTGWSRDALRISVDPMYDAAIKESKEKASGIMTLFGLMGDDNEERFAKEPDVKIKTEKFYQLIKEKELLGFFLTGHPMDGYRELLQRLSCVPLHDTEKMDHDAIFRAAILIESIETRISSKNGRKFAITMISDGAERYELPIWSDLYEEKGHLLRENQLLYMVLQVDKREDVLKISCKWFDDLTQVNESTVDACDKAYDKAKLMAGRNFMKKESKLKDKEDIKKKPLPPLKDMPKVKSTRLKISLNADRLQLSHVLSIKKILRQYAGSRPIDIDFESREKSLGVVAIESTWGIDGSVECIQALKAMDVVQMVED
ncbi:MAG: DNA polymerase III subunit alpha [Parachlamydiales bacterium]|nr:DNA polymerase III subunit alpha [Parachlamydiales bacterium]